MKTIDIEAFLTWAYLHELPKAGARGAAPAASSGGAGGWDAVSRQGVLMTEMISDGRLNSYGVMSLPIDCGPPHPDALTLHDVVGELTAMDLTIPDDWSPLGGLGLSIDEQRAAVDRAIHRVAHVVDGRIRLLLKPVELVRRYAILGSAPCWEAETPKARFVSVHGKALWYRKVPIEARGLLFEQEVSGYDERAKRPFPGAYRKTTLEPDPALAVVDRAEYEVWHAALAMLVETLAASDALFDHRVVPSKRPARPWA
jgi:hypothetical protein